MPGDRCLHKSIPTFDNLSGHQQRREHLLPIFFAHFCLGGGHTRLGFEPIPASRASPKIKDQPLTNEFRPIRSNQRLTTFGTRRRHDDLLCLFLFSASRVGSFFGIVTVTSSTLLFALIQIKNEAFFAPLCELQCGNMRAQPTIPLNPPQQGSALVFNCRDCDWRVNSKNSDPHNPGKHHLLHRRVGA
jgi:hypothetical protein